MTLGEAWFDQGQFRQAVQMFQKAIYLYPALEPILVHRIALAFHYSSRLREAAATFEIAMVYAEYASNPSIYFDFGVTLQHQGKILDANEKYNRAIALRRDFPEAWLNIASLHHRHGDITMAIPNYHVCYLTFAHPYDP